MGVASIFKRMSELAPLAKFGAGVTDASQTYKVGASRDDLRFGRQSRELMCPEIPCPAEDCDRRS